MANNYRRRDFNFSNEEKCKGQIQVIFGPMFSGKTTELLRRIKRYRIANYHCVLIKYAKDCRYDKDGVSTHDQQKLHAICGLKLDDVADKCKDCDVIGIDEGQFFPDIVAFCDKMAETGKIVIVAALDGTFQRKGFGDILNLVPIAESVTKLTAVCMGCFQDASFTKRKGCETQVEVIGGAEKYEASCRQCFDKSATDSSPEKENHDESSTGFTKLMTRQKRPLTNGYQNTHPTCSPPKIKTS